MAINNPFKAHNELREKQERAKNQRRASQGPSSGGRSIVLRNNPNTNESIQQGLRDMGYNEKTIKRLADKDNQAAFENDMQNYKAASREEKKLNYNHYGVSRSQHKENVKKFNEENQAQLNNAKKEIANKYGISEKEFDTAYNQYKNSKESTNRSMDLWNSPDYKMTKADKEEFKKAEKDYFSTNEKAKAIKKSPNINVSRKILESMTPEEREEYARYASVSNKINPMTSFATGITSAIPSYNNIYNKASGKIIDDMGLEGDYSYKTAVENAGKQNKAAQIGGNVAGTMAMYGLANAAIPSLPGVGKATKAIGDAVGKTGLGVAGGEAVTGLLNDTLADVSLDTLPEYVSNRKNGMSRKEAGVEALKNIGVNTAFNLLPTGIDALKKYGESSNDVVKNLIKENPDYNSVVDGLIKQNPIKPNEADEVVESVAKEMPTNAIENANVENAVKEVIPQENVVNYPTDRPATPQEVRELLANPNLSKEEKDAIIDAANNKKPIPENLGLNKTTVEPEVKEIPQIQKVNETVNTPETTEKISQFYSNTAKHNMSAEDYESLEPKNFINNSMSEKTSMSTAKENIARNGIDSRKEELLQKNFESSVDTDEAMMIYHSYKEKASKLREAGDIEGYEKAELEALHMLRKVGSQGSKSGKVLQALKKWNRNTPEGSLAYAMAKVDEAGSKLVGKAKAKQIEKLEDSIVSVFKDNSLTKEDKLKKVTELFEANKLVSGEKEIKKAITEGKVLDSVDLASELKKANGILQMTPEQQLAYLDEAKKLETMQPGSKEYRLQMAKLGKTIDSMIPNSFGDYFKGFLYDNMLGSIRTIVSRNMGGNLGMQVMERTATKQVAAGIDKVLSKLTKNEHRLRGMSLQTTKDYAHAFGKAWGESWQEVMNVWKKGAEDLRLTKTGFDDISDYFDANKHLKTDSKNAFLQKASKIFDKWDSSIKTVMNAGDKPFYEGRYAECISEWTRMRESGEAFRSLSDEEFKEYCDIFAKIEASAAVYQNNSEMALAFQQMKNAIGKYSEAATGLDVASQFVMPMVQVPGNVADRILQYSPFGFIKTGVLSGGNYLSNGDGKLLNKLKTGKIDQDFQGELATMLARNLIGTGVSAAGWGLKELGDKTAEKYGKDKAFGLTGSFDEDTGVASAQRENGEQEFALRAGGKDRDISWLTGLGTALQAGATAADAYDKNGDMAKAILKGISGAFDNSMTQGLNRLVGGDNAYSYDTDNNFITNMYDTIRAGGSQFIPAWLRQTASATDKYKRDLGEYKSDEYYKNSLKNGVPFLRQTLDKKVGTNGEYLEQNAGMGALEKAWTNYLSPGTTTNLSDNEAYDEAMRIYKETGNKGALLPGYSRKNIATDYLGLDKNEKLTTKQYEDAKMELGKANSEIFDTFSKSELFKSLDDEGKADLLKSGYQIAQYDFKAKNKRGGFEPTQNKNEFEAYQEGGAKGLIDYLSNKEKSNKAGYSSVADYEKALAEGGQKAIEEHTKEKQKIDELDSKLDLDKKIKEIKKTEGVEINKSKYAELYGKGGQKAVDRYISDVKLTEETNKKYGLTGDDRLDIKDIRKAKQSRSIDSVALNKKDTVNFNNTYNQDIATNVYKGYKEKGASDKEIATVLNIKKEVDSDKKEDIVKYLGQSNMSDTEKSNVLKYTLQKSTLDSAYVKAGVSTFGESSLYTIMTHYDKANLDGKGNQPTKKEAQQYVNETFRTQEERDKWFYVLYGASHQKKK